MVHPRTGLYSAARRIFTPLFKSIYDIEINGLENLPKGAGILAANHSSYLDPFVIGVCVPKDISFVSLNFSECEGTLQNRISDFFTKHLGSVVLSRVEAAKHIGQEEEILNGQAGFVKSIFDYRGYLGIFPEGRVRYDGNRSRFHRGAAWIAIKNNVPVVPIGLGGTHEVWPKAQALPNLGGKIVVNIGEPIMPSGSDSELTDKLKEDILRLAGD